MKKNLQNLKTNLINWMSHSTLPLISNPKIINITEHLLTVNFIKYLIIGFTTFFLDFGIFQFLNTRTSIQGLAANMTSTLLSLAFNFYMSNFWTFKAGGEGKMHKLSKYGTLAIINYTITNTFFYVVSELMHVNPLLTKVIITGIIVCWNYFLYKLWIFKSEQTQH